MKKQVHLFFSGRVQGIGFRYTAENLANKLDVTGWVKNLRDGRVEVLAQAEEEVLKDFLNKLSDYFSRYIKDVEVSWQDASGDFSGFEVEF
ncbi:MAG: acylphosphatase [Candidatus Omnitrophica bacterium]|nr:acylphosphatase [Candidatus Omnitrophota bacterium]